MHNLQQDLNPAIKRILLDFITQEGFRRPLLSAFITSIKRLTDLILATMPRI